MSFDSAIWAAARFGLGPRPQDNLDASEPAAAWLERHWRKEVEAARFQLTPNATDARSDELVAAFEEGGADAMHRKRKQVFVEDMRARMAKAVVSASPLAERLTRFWVNHFCVSTKKALVRGYAGPYEKEVVRPHIFGRFADMLIAAARHPAMLLYLDNAGSIGPNSEFGRRHNLGLNENFAREALELHSLGADGGYTQQDVRELSRILTGWSMVHRPERLPDGRPRGYGRFVFRARGHEPGPKTLLGQRYDQGGEEEGFAALEALAAHPSTARNLARKLARHFLDDEPAPDAVSRIAAAYERSGGDLPSVYAALFAERPSAPLSKIRRPEELVIATLRGAGLDANHPAVARGVNWTYQLGQPIFTAPSPEGWPDDAGSLVSPEAMLRRVRWARSAADKLIDDVDPRRFADTVLSQAGAKTRFLIENAPSRVDGLALALAAPSFHRR